MFAIFVPDPTTPWAALDRVHSSLAVLGALLAVAAVAYLLVWVGFVGLVLRGFGALTRGSVRAGFRTWEALFAWAPWPAFLGIVLGLLVVGVAAGGLVPWAAVGCGLAAVFMGVTACLAYMTIDLERYEVERGYKAVHDPLKGQGLALNLIRHGDRVGLPLLAAAAVGAVGGFALLNQGLYGTVGRAWYVVGSETAAPGFLDFLVYALVNLYQVIDVLDLAGSYRVLQFTFVRKAAWPAGVLLMGFKSFFTLILLQQLFASVRQGQALSEAIADFWSPHPPISERARNSLPRHGAGVVRPLLESLRAVPALTKEQRDQLPRVIAGIGPTTVPALAYYLDDPHEGVRGVAAAALGQLHALDAIPAVARLTTDPSELVRQEAVGALGVIGGTGVKTARRRSRVSHLWRPSGRSRWVFGRRGERAEAHQPDRVSLAVGALRAALNDPAAAVRVAAARALGQVGPAAAPAAPDLAARLADADETVRCGAAESLGRVGDPSAVEPLTGALADPGPAVRAAAARALGAFREDGQAAVPALVRLLQDSDDEVREAAGETVGRIGTLPGEAADALAAGLTSPDSLVRARTAEALGAIGEAAAPAVPALADALTSGNDRVRAKAAEALGKIGEAAAEVAVPTLVRALRDRDNWVSALAAEAIGQMGEAASEAVPALVKSLRHVNPLVRANAVEALGKLGPAAASARSAVEAAAHDPDGGVRAAALRALPEVAPPGTWAGAAVSAGLSDPDPRVRAAAAGAVSRAGVGEFPPSALLGLLDDPNDQVKFQAVRGLPALAGPTPDAVDGLCRRLAEDDSPWIRETAAQAIGSLGPTAAAAGPALLRAVRTGEEAVREAAVRAVALVQPPEAAEALTGAMADASPDVRKVASAGWMRAAEIPESAVPALVEALRDPEVQVRANAAHALGRLAELPAEAVPLLVECATDPNDGLRMNAAAALRTEPAAAFEALRRLTADPNSRVQLIAAGAVLTREPADPDAVAVVTAALFDPALRLRQGALDAVAALGDLGVGFRDAVRKLAAGEDDPGLRDRAAAVLARLDALPAAEPTPADAAGVPEPVAAA